ncbi:endonuclease/exonuclease/phosphatase family protein [Sorangium sp. So ce1389]|uniref:endonuclease/exonuclease/phosphatase family protein n=1 Tax=Sorangium sp. So ce1389 TaxID=3133336 RepID=UPI003F5F799D
MAATTTAALTGIRRASLSAMPFQVATFNAGLAVGVLPYATERVPRVIEALAGLDVDLLFVQEFWLDAHWDLLRRALESRLPHAFRPEPAHPAAHGACSASQVRPLVACAEAKCDGLTDEALARCVVQSCASTALTLPTPCLNCIASRPVGTIHEIVDRCVGEPTASQASPAGRSSRYGGLIAYGGSFGTGLLARAPLEARDILVFESTVNARGALYARVAAPGLGALHIFAAHLSPGGAEQPPQVERLLAWVDEKAGGAPALLLGDLNTTPGSSLFRRLEGAGFRDADVPDRRGTFSHDGLGTGDVGDSGWRLDHVLLRGLDARLRVGRILDAPVTISAEGRPVRTTLSDHFGVLATIGER